MTNSSPPSAENTRRRTNPGFYGRRLGRPLRHGRQELLETLLPTVGVRVAAGRPVDLSAQFGPSQPVWVELGFGAGEHLAWQAIANPGVGMLGCELFLNGISSLLRHVRDQGLTNVRIADADAVTLLAALPAESVARLFLLFPDPWPKARHHKRRLIQSPTLGAIARILVDGAEFRFATDHAGYCAWVLSRVLRHDAFDWPAESVSDWRSRPPDWPPTRYESLARAGKPVFLSFRRRPRHFGGQ